MVGFLDFGYGKGHPMVLQLERELEQKRREHREGKLESAQLGAMAKKLEALEKNSAKLEQDIAQNHQEIE
ncbi:MAG: hypothetical protein ACKPKO_44435, partial [Candidatus Fonsibacter sp.]